MSLRHLGVRTRIAVGVGGVFLVALVVALGALVVSQRRALTRDIETTARLRADDLVAAIDSGSVPSSIAIPHEDRSFVQIVDGAGSVLASSPNIEGEAALFTFTGGPGGPTARTTAVPTVSDETFRVVAETTSSGGEPVRVYVGSSLAAVAEAGHTLVVALALGGPVLVAVVVGLTWVAVGRALRPVERIRAEVAEIGDRDLHRRIAEPAARDEIGRLAETMNTMLERLDDASVRKRQFLADASHELRSPLAGIRSQIEVDLAHPGRAAWEVTARDVLGETLHMQRLVEDLMELARLDADPAPGDHEVVDLDEIVLTEVRRLTTRGRVRVDARGVGAVQVTGGPGPLGRVVRNLLDNAERHAVGKVSVVLGEDGPMARLVVADDGPGVVGADRERIFERFARSDSSRARDDGGSGLGLAIAREIVVAHGGVLELDLGEPGSGASFVVRLPRDRSDEA